MSITNEHVYVMQLDQLPILIGKEVHIKNESIALFRLSNGEVRAIGSRCPHTNGPLAEGIVSGEFVYCPLQDWKVSLVTGHVQPPDEGAVPTYDVILKNGEIYVSL
ncbi:nitrite reductase (NAD(P)H) small subunit [Salipaludibacillus sp. LMS25]|uniref:nitrite reductase (NAD(P)H) small subunit n=1 Tax=Salipaludibacillus sp. LMS25 TaxID=2924031 RepID=UPI0020D0AD13|nr:nitrite reductase (NAD(P)H) small subunit [Salipaludibacillus sp. LMS25]UTR14997.1 nitrite reductase (NAD(P)H) small subunit [Salipaludibacillus sp. LMS25]